MQKSRLRVNLFLILLFFTLAVFQQAYRIGFEWIKIWDEASSAQNAIEMMANKHYFVVYNDGKPDHLDVKPPLALWLKIISYKIFGINEFSVRFPTIVAFWITLLLFILFALFFLKTPEIAWIILIIAATSKGFIFYHIARHGDPDTLLTMFVTGYLLSFFIVLEKIHDHYLKYLVITGLFIVGAVYTKSVAGIAPLAGIALFTIFDRNGRFLITRRAFYLTVASILIITLVYYIAREFSDPGYLRSVLKFEINVVSDYPGKTPKHPEPGYYLNFLWHRGFRPWIYFVPFSLIPIFLSKNRRNKRLIMYSLTGAVVFLIGQSSALMKNHWYIAPVYPFLWLALAVSFYEISHLIMQWQKSKAFRISVLILIFLFPAYSATRMYIQMIRDNYIKPDAYIYEPERSGQYLNQIKTEYPEYKELISLTREHQRQLKFYAKKYQYEDSTSVEISRSIHPGMVNKKVFVTDSVNRKLLVKAFHTSLIDSAKYGSLYHIQSIKDSTLLY